MQALNKRQNLNEISTWLMDEAHRYSYMSSLSYYDKGNRSFSFYFDNSTKKYKLEVLLWWVGIVVGFFTLCPDFVGYQENIPALANILMSVSVKTFVFIGSILLALGLYSVAKWFFGEGDTQFHHRFLAPFEFNRQYQEKRKEFDLNIQRLEKDISKREKVLKYLEDAQRPDAEEIFSSVTLDEIKKIVDNV